MLCSKEDIKVYEKIDNMIENGEIESYDEDIVDFLNTHSNNGESSYIEELCSTSGAKYNFKFSRYLMIYLKDKGAKLKEGTLSSLRDGKFDHYWIELDDCVYDTTFIGKWDKDSFYDVLYPINIQEVDLDKDIDFILYNKNDKKISCEEYKELEYLDWYRYNKNNTISVFPLTESLKMKKFPKQYIRKLK